MADGNANLELGVCLFGWSFSHSNRESPSTPLVLRITRGLKCIALYSTHSKCTKYVTSFSSRDVNSYSILVQSFDINSIRSTCSRFTKQWRFVKLCLLVTWYLWVIIIIVSSILALRHRLIDTVPRNQINLTEIKHWLLRRGWRGQTLVPREKPLGKEKRREPTNSTQPIHIGGRWDGPVAEATVPSLLLISIIDFSIVMKWNPRGGGDSLIKTTGVLIVPFRG